MNKGSGARRTGAGNHRAAWTATWTATVLLGLATPSWAQIQQGDLTIRFEDVATGLASPVYLTNAGDGSGRLFVVDQAGTIRIIKDGELLDRPFLDLTGEIPVLNANFDERGVLGMAFHPDYRNNGRFFVRYSRPRTSGPIGPCMGTSRGCHEEVLAEFHVTGDPDVADPNGRLLFRIDKTEFNHNAGAVAFGPDGFLYFSLGDGGGANDDLHNPELWHTAQGNGQNIETPLGAMLRIDVNSSSVPYGIPTDNPFVARAGINEIYAWGFRNPFRFSFDDGPGGDGTLYLGDVGQDVYEELDIVERGANYGWARREGMHCFDPFNPKGHPKECDTDGLTDPIVEYSQSDGGLSIIAGFVYRGSQWPGLFGRFIFGDFSMAFQQPLGRLYYLDEPEPGKFQILEFRITSGNVPYGKFLKGFGRDEAGEIYVLGTTTLGPTGTSGVVQRIAFVPPCTGKERIEKARCKAGDGGNQLTVRLVGGAPGDTFTVVVSGGGKGNGAIDANGEGKVKFRGLPPGDGTATVTWGCGASQEASYSCP